MSVLQETACPTKEQPMMLLYDDPYVMEMMPNGFEYQIFLDTFCEVNCGLIQLAASPSDGERFNESCVAECTQSLLQTLPTAPQPFTFVGFILPHFHFRWECRSRQKLTPFLFDPATCLMFHSQAHSHNVQHNISHG